MKGELPFREVGKDRLAVVVVVVGVEIKGLVLNLCSSSNFMVPCGYDNTNSHRTLASV